MFYSLIFILYASSAHVNITVKVTKLDLGDCDSKKI